MIVTASQRDTVPLPAGGARGQLSLWMSQLRFQQAVDERFPGCRVIRAGTQRGRGTEGIRLEPFIRWHFHSVAGNIRASFSMGPVGFPHCPRGAAQALPTWWQACG